MAVALASAMKPLCRALLVLNVLYCILAAAQEGLPGWHMFESAAAAGGADAELTDKDGRPVDLQAALPRGARVDDRGEMRSIVTWLCRRDRSRAPFTYRERSPELLVTLGDDCRIHAPR